jgi:hypothetical protein
MAVGISPAPSNRQPCVASTGITLSAGDGTKTGYVRFRDALDNETSDYTDTILLDTTGPTFTFSNNS